MVRNGSYLRGWTRPTAGRPTGLHAAEALLLRGRAARLHAAAPVLGRWAARGGAGLAGFGASWTIRSKAGALFGTLHGARFQVV